VTSVPIQIHSLRVGEAHKEGVFLFTPAFAFMFWTINRHDRPNKGKAALDPGNVMRYLCMTAEFSPPLGTGGVAEIAKQTNQGLF
jgi:hypothetical protein